MDIGRVVTGAIIGGTIGVAGAMLAFTSERQRKSLMRQGRQTMNKMAHKIM